MDAEIGVIGGSGLYSLLENAEATEIETEYGKPSGKISVGKVGDTKVAFLPRHGEKHTIPPHKVPYRANIEALNSLGVKRIIATSACGSLNRDFRMGQVVFLDQFMSMVFSREDTFYDKDEVFHVSPAYPYCSSMRASASATSTDLGIDHKNMGSAVIVNGPRFSTKAESLFYSTKGFDLINMTQYPEVVLARERAICYLGIGVVTDYDAGLLTTGGVQPVAYEEVIRTMSQNTDKLKSLITGIIKDLPKERNCTCKDATKGATTSAQD